MVYSNVAMKMTCLSEENTQHVAQQLAQRVTTRDALLLTGELGAGKTTFTQALLRALGVTDDITSPTYAIAHTYQVTNFNILHMDAYRLHSLEECLTLDLPTLSRDHLVLMEWPPVGVEKLLPQSHILRLHLDYAPQGRILTLMGDENWTSRLTEKPLEPPPA